MNRDDLLKRWPSDVERLLRFRREHELEEWPQPRRGVVPPELDSVVELVTLLTMSWEEVQLVKQQGIVSEEFAKFLDERFMAVEEQIHAWDVATQASDPLDRVVMVREFCEAVDTAVYWNRGIRYLDETLRG
jgi:hypothetical protein